MGGGRQFSVIWRADTLVHVSVEELGVSYTCIHPFPKGFQ